MIPKRKTEAVNRMNDNAMAFCPFQKVINASATTYYWIVKMKLMVPDVTPLGMLLDAAI